MASSPSSVRGVAGMTSFISCDILKWNAERQKTIHKLIIYMYTYLLSIGGVAIAKGCEVDVDVARIIVIMKALKCWTLAEVNEHARQKQTQTQDTLWNKEIL